MIRGCWKGKENGSEFSWCYTFFFSCVLTSIRISGSNARKSALRVSHWHFMFVQSETRSTRATNSISALFLHNILSLQTVVILWHVCQFAETSGCCRAESLLSETLKNICCNDFIQTPLPAMGIESNPKCRSHKVDSLMPIDSLIAFKIKRDA